LNQFNLIISTYRFREEEAQDETLDLLEEFGDPDAVCEITEIRGILLAETSMEPTNVVEKLRQITTSEPWQIRYILRVLPVMSVVASDIEAIADAASKLGTAIKSQDTFRITVEKRHTALESMDVINAVARRFQNPVDLEDPDWIVLVQIVGAVTGVSVITPDQVFSSVVEKRK
jgi:tRNA acetyltransferase TAN1